MICDKTYISKRDFIDIYFKVKQKGYNEYLSITDGSDSRFGIYQNKHNV